MVAVGGAIKDAPYEGFEIIKFMRSPIIGMVEAPILGKVFHEPNPVLLGLSTIATERMTTESYKLIRAKLGYYKPSKFTYGEWGNPVPSYYGVANPADVANPALTTLILG